MAKPFDRIGEFFERIPLLSTTHDVDCAVVAGDPVLGLSLGCHMATAGLSVGIHVVPMTGGFPYWIYDNAVILDLLSRLSKRPVARSARDWLRASCEFLQAMGGNYVSDTLPIWPKRVSSSSMELTFEPIPNQFKTEIDDQRDLQSYAFFQAKRVNVLRVAGSFRPRHVRFRSLVTAGPSVGVIEQDFPYLDLGAVLANDGLSDCHDLKSDEAMRATLDILVRTMNQLGDFSVRLKKEGGL